VGDGSKKNPFSPPPCTRGPGKSTQKGGIRKWHASVRGAAGGS
jgi:hypothetical protein